MTSRFEHLITANGPTVSSTGPDTLRAMLEDYEDLLSSLGVPVRDYLVPGAGHQTIVDEFASIGVTPNEELVVWFEWANGVVFPATRPKTGQILPFMNPVSVEWAASNYAYMRDNHDEDGRWAWSPGWVGIEDSPYRLNVSCIGPSSEPPLVQNADPEGHEVGSNTNEYQVVSMCTLVAYWVEAIELGAARWISERNVWHLEIDKLPHQAVAVGMVP